MIWKNVSAWQRGRKSINFTIAPDTNLFWRRLCSVFDVRRPLTYRSCFFRHAALSQTHNISQVSNLKCMMQRTNKLFKSAHLRKRAPVGVSDARNLVSVCGQTDHPALRIIRARSTQRSIVINCAPNELQQTHKLLAVCWLYKIAKHRRRHEFFKVCYGAVLINGKGCDLRLRFNRTIIILDLKPRVFIYCALNFQLQTPNSWFENLS
jgi:hypothetical protein